MGLSQLPQGSNPLVETGVWTAYTPTLTQGGAVTKNVTSARYTRIGRTIIANVRLAVTAAGTGGSPVLVGLPVVAGVTAGVTIGSGWIFDASTNTFYDGASIDQSSGATAGVFVDGVTSAAPWGQSPNIALASGDIVSVHVVYEAAS